MYIVAQTIGAFLACALVYAQYKFAIDKATVVLTDAGTLGSLLFTPEGPAGGFTLYLPSGQTLGPTFLLTLQDTFIGLVIWATFDPTNVFIPPALGPVLVSLA